MIETMDDTPVIEINIIFLNDKYYISVMLVVAFVCLHLYLR